MRVPVYERQLGINPVQRAQVSPVMPAGDFGTSAGKALQGVAARLAKFQADTEDARTLELFNKFKLDSQQYHENPDTGIYNTRLGYSASGVYEQSDNWLRQRGEFYANDLKSERAKANFRKMAEEHILQRGQQNSRFEAEQIRKYQYEMADATVNNWLNYAEQNYNNQDAVNEARKHIGQALELKMRGSSNAAFRSAYDEIENQIGIARIRQAYTKDPLLAVRMLADKDIKLKPETRAQLQQNLTKQTEVYELQAIAQTYSKHYSPENSVQAHDELIKQYGADKGEKAFSALSRIWSIENSQKNAREHNILENQQKNEADFIRRFTDPAATKPTEQEVINAMRNKSIRPEAAQSYIRFIQSKQASDAEQAREDFVLGLKINAQQGVHLPRDTLLTLYGNKILKEGDFNELVNAPEKEKKAQQQVIQEAQKVNEQNVTLRMLTDDDKPTIDELNLMAQSQFISPEYAKSTINTLKSEQQNDEQARKSNLQNLLSVQARNGGFIPDEQLDELVLDGRIDREFANQYYRTKYSPDTALAKANELQRKDNNYQYAMELFYSYGIENQDQAFSEIQKLKREDAEQVRTYFRQFITDATSVRTEKERTQSQQEKELNEQAKQNKEKHEHDLRNKAQQLAKAYPIGQRQGFDDWLNGQNYSIEDKEFLTVEYEKHLSQQNKIEQERLQADEKLHSDLYRVLKLQAMDKDNPVHLEYDELVRMNLDGVLKDNEFKELNNLREEYLAKQVKLAIENERKDKQAFEHDTWVNVMNGNIKSKDYLFELAKNNLISEERYNEYAGIIDKNKNAQDKTERDFHEREYYQKGVELADRLGLGHEQEAYAELDTYSPEDRAISKRAYEERIQELRTIKNNQDKEKIEAQKQNYRAYHDYWDKSQPVPIDTLRQDYKDEKINPEQFEQAKIMNAKLSERAGIEASLSQNLGERFNNLSRSEQEAMIMERMGVNEEMHRGYFLELFKKILDGTITDELVDWYFANGRITTDDKARLKDYDSKFEREQKSRVQEKVNELTAQMRELKIPGKDKKLYEDLAVNDFYNAVRWLDPHASNFNDAVQQAMVTAITAAINAASERFPTSGFWGATPFGKRVEQTQSNLEKSQPIVPGNQIYYEPINGQNGFMLDVSGDLSEFTNTIELSVPPEVSTVSEDVNYSEIPQEYFTPYYPQRNTELRQQVKALQGVIDFTKAFTDKVFNITSGFSEMVTSLRNGRAHRANDVGMPENTPLKVPQGDWTVKSTGENSTAGKHITITTNLTNGDVLDVTLAHLNDFDVKQGDILTSGEIFAKSGNTGHSTGPHLHISTKINGKPVNPQNVNVGNANNTAPQPLVPPVRSSDAEINTYLMSVFFGGNALSNDVFTNIPYGGF